MSDSNFKRYYLDIHTIGANVQIGLNGVPLISDPHGDGIRTLLPVNEWVMPKDNRLTVHLAWPERKSFAPGTAELRVAFFEANPNSKFPEPQGATTEALWPAANVPELYPHSLDIPLVIEKSPPTTLWTEAETVEKLADSDRAQMLELTENLRRTLMAGDFESTSKLLAYRYADDARANLLNLDELRSIIDEQYAGMLAEPSPTSRPLDPDAASFVQAAGNRIVKVTGPNHREAIVIETDEARYQVPVFVAKVSGRWTIVR